VVDDQWSMLDRLRKSALSQRDLDREPFVAELLSTYLHYRPEDAFAWFIYGDTLRVLGRFQEARVSLRRAIGLAPSEHKWSVRIRFGMLCTDAGRHVAAERWMRRAAESPEANALDWFWILRGANLAHGGKLDQAEACHREAIRINPDNDEAHLNLGFVLRAKRMYSEALSAFRIAHALDPGDSEASSAIESLSNISEALDLIRPFGEGEAHLNGDAK
jgi:protein O-GlcNAc transferase